MNVIIKPSEEFYRHFKRLSKKYCSLVDDYRVFREDLISNPFQGVDLGSGVRKVRMAIGAKGKGKSGGARVLTLTILVSDDAEITLLTIYDKSEMENVSDKYINWLVERYK